MIEAQLGLEPSELKSPHQQRFLRLVIFLNLLLMPVGGRRLPYVFVHEFYSQKSDAPAPNGRSDMH